MIDPHELNIGLNDEDTRLALGDYVARYLKLRSLVMRAPGALDAIQAYLTPPETEGEVIPPPDDAPDDAGG